MPLAAKFQDNRMLKPKRPIFKNYTKTQYFCAFFEYHLISIKHKDDMTTISKKHEKALPETSIFEQKISFFRPRCWNAEFRGLRRDLGLDFGGLGEVLGSSRGILGPTALVLSPTLTPKYLHEDSHTTQLKKREIQGS